jgi:hypothetical protein
VRTISADGTSSQECRSAVASTGVGLGDDAALRATANAMSGSSINTTHDGTTTSREQQPARASNDSLFRPSGPPITSFRQHRRASIE